MTYCMLFLMFSCVWCDNIIGCAIWCAASVHWCCVSEIVHTLDCRVLESGCGLAGVVSGLPAEAQLVYPCGMWGLGLMTVWNSGFLSPGYCLGISLPCQVTSCWFFILRLSQWCTVQWTSVAVCVTASIDKCHLSDDVCICSCIMKEHLLIFTHAVKTNLIWRCRSSGKLCCVKQ